MWVPPEGRKRGFAALSPLTVFGAAFAHPPLPGGNEECVKRPVRRRTPAENIPGNADSSMGSHCGRLARRPPRPSDRLPGGSPALLPPAPASAAFPPPTVFPERDFIAVEYWPANTPVRVEVVRNGVLVTT